MKNWDDLRYFVAVERAGSMLGAARALGVNTATVSRHIDRLEAAIGKRLFFRNTTGYELSEEGEKMLPYARSLEEVILGIDRATASDESVEGVVTVTLTEALAEPFLIPLLPQFSREHPKIRIEMIRDDRSLNLSRREADIGLRLVRPRQNGLKLKRIGKLRFGFYASRAYLREAGKPRTLQDLANHDTIGWVDAFANLGPIAWWSSVVERPSVYCSNSPSCREAAAASGLGIALLPRVMARSNAALEPVLQSVEIPTLDIWLVFHQDLARGHRIRAFVDFIQTHAAKQEF